MLWELTVSASDLPACGQQLLMQKACSARPSSGEGGVSDELAGGQRAGGSRALEGFGAACLLWEISTIESEDLKLSPQALDLARLDRISLRHIRGNPLVRKDMAEHIDTSRCQERREEPKRKPPLLRPWSCHWQMRFCRLACAGCSAIALFCTQSAPRHTWQHHSRSARRNSHGSQQPRLPLTCKTTPASLTS